MQSHATIEQYVDVAPSRRKSFELNAKTLAGEFIFRNGARRDGGNDYMAVRVLTKRAKTPKTGFRNALGKTVCACVLGTRRPIG